MRIFSSGGGVQSTAALVLAARKEIDFPTHVFCNVGDDSENPDTLRYVTEHIEPYAKAHGIEFVTLQKRRRDGSLDTIYSTLLRRQRSIDFPVWMANGAPGNRQCTLRFKRGVVSKYTKQQGATPENPAIVGVGFSLDEYQRMRSTSGIDWELREYPLIDLRITRDDCFRLVEEAGLPTPPKSSCWFCPYHSTEQWQELRASQPELFDKAVELEDLLNIRREALGRDHIYLSSKTIPLRQIDTKGEELEGACDIGHCMT